MTDAEAFSTSTPAVVQEAPKNFPTVQITATTTSKGKILSPNRQAAMPTTNRPKANPIKSPMLVHQSWFVVIRVAIADMARYGSRTLNNPTRAGS